MSRTFAAAIFTLTAVVGGLRAASAETYYVNVLTNDDDAAGTNEPVYITLYGERGETAEFELDKPDHDDLEAGQWDYYKFSHPKDLGRITQVKLRLAGDDDGWGPKMVYVLGPRDPAYPGWKTEGAGPLDPSRQALDFYRFPPGLPFLRNGDELLLKLDERGQRDLATVLPDHYRNWTSRSRKWLYIKSFKCISPSSGINDPALIASHIAAYVPQVGLAFVPHCGEMLSEAYVCFAQGNNDSLGESGEDVLVALDKVFAGADEFYFKVNDRDIRVGHDGGLWTRLDQDDQREVNHKVHLRGLTKIELMEYDRIENDSLGGFIINPNAPVTQAVGGMTAMIAHKANGSIYRMNYYIVESDKPNPRISIEGGRAVCR
ncbi:MAG: PLAT/LH2 domain-containing protein [Planctomycetaceae bacterium]|nr:PLAT/LH2 domain-containing protein [Planctomycetaceae bacterium]